MKLVYVGGHFINPEDISAVINTVHNADLPNIGVRKGDPMIAIYVKSGHSFLSLETGADFLDNLGKKTLEI